MGLNMLLTIFAFILFGSLLISDDSLMSKNIELEAQNEVALEAFGQIQSLIDEAKSKAFDENTTPSEVSSVSGMSTTLGTDNLGENISLPDTLASSKFASVSHFDDVDDYNGYVRLIRRTSRDGDTIRVSVAYTSVTNPDTTGFTGKSYCKKMTVTLTSPFFQKPTPSSPLPSYSMTYIFTY